MSATLSLDEETVASPDRSLEVYEAALRAPAPAFLRAARVAWTALGLAGLVALAFAEPWSARAAAAAAAAGAPAWLIACVFVPAVMTLRAVLLIEAVGYFYHRFFQHLGPFTRLAQVFRRNQRFHWIHHMIIYPIGRFYQRDGGYVSSEAGISWSWVIPGVAVMGVAVATMGAHLGTVVFVAAGALYAKYVIDEAHSRFHLTRHSWQGSRYFQWLEDIHLLHHWDQDRNFTIIHPAMDFIFGTYLSPRSHPRELEVCRRDNALTVSDITNWRYLLTEATPSEYAAFISEAKKHPRSQRKLERLIQVLSWRLERRPGDDGARDLLGKARDLSVLIRP